MAEATDRSSGEEVNGRSLGEGVTDRPTRVSIVEFHAIFSDALRISLGNRGFEAVSVPVAPTGVGRRDLLHAVIKTQPGVVLLDLNLGPAGDGAALIEPLSLAGRRVVVLTASQDHLKWGECLARGAVAVVPKVVPLHVIVDVIRRADQGLQVHPGAERERLIELWRDHRGHSDERRKWLARLTPREAHVLEQLAHGKRVRQVAEDDFVAETTVRTHVKAILAKLGVKSQLAAVAIVHDVGWTPASAELPEPAHYPPAIPPHHGTLHLAQESISSSGSIEDLHHRPAGPQRRRARLLAASAMRPAPTLTGTSYVVSPDSSSVRQTATTSFPRG